MGGLLFFFIEHCYAPTPRPLDSHENSYNEICSKVFYIQQNLTNNFTTTSNTSLTSTLLNDKDLQLKINIADHTIKMCLDFPPKSNVRKCKMDISKVWEWFDYTASVAFTTGILLASHVMSKTMIRLNLDLVRYKDLIIFIFKIK